MIKNLLLDLGGVMVTLDKSQAVKRFEQLGIHDAGQLLDPYKQSGIFLRLECGEFTREEFVSALNKTYNLTLTVADVEWALLGYFVSVGAEKFDYILHSLPKNIRVFCLSNTNPFVHSVMEQTKFLPSGIPVPFHFESMFLSYEEGMCKPDHQLFQTVINRTGIRPEETLFLDDGAANTAAARAMGFITYKPDNGEDWRPIVDKLVGNKA